MRRQNHDITYIYYFIADIYESQRLKMEAHKSMSLSLQSSEVDRIALVYMACKW